MAVINQLHTHRTGDKDDFMYSHDELALGIYETYFKENARFVPKWGKWLLWDDVRWVLDEKLQVFSLIRNYLRNQANIAFSSGCNKDVVKQLRQAATVANVEQLARSNDYTSLDASAFDSDTALLGTPGGTVCLKTGKLNNASRETYITKLTAVSPCQEGLEPTLWLSFLNTIFCGDESLIHFAQTAAGYALTGCTNEHKLFFLYGTGSNGKSVFLNTLFDVMGDYSKRASSQTFIKSNGSGHPTDVAGLQGARFVAGSELPAGKVWNEAVIKDLTGGDKITARFMRQDYFDFLPQFSLFIAGNHQPSFSGIDEAIRRRVILIPFTQTISEQDRDPHLAEKLIKEWPQILAWAIKGAKRWYEDGLVLPNSIEQASNEYMDDEDTFADFISEHLVKAEFGQILCSDVYNRFKNWQLANGVPHVWSQKAMTTEFKARGIVQKRKSNGRYFVGVRLK